MTDLAELLALLKDEHRQRGELNWASYTDSENDRIQNEIHALRLAIRELEHPTVNGYVLVAHEWEYKGGDTPRHIQENWDAQTYYATFASACRAVATIAKKYRVNLRVSPYRKEKPEWDK